MITLLKDKANSAGEIVLDGEVTIQHAANLKDELTTAINSCKNLKVNVDKLTDMDVTGLQLLFSAQKTAANKSIPFSIVQSENSYFESLLKESGFIFNQQPE